MYTLIYVYIIAFVNTINMNNDINSINRQDHHSDIDPNNKVVSIVRENCYKIYYILNILYILIISNLILYLI